MAFFSSAANLAPGATGLGEVYLRDRTAGTTELISQGMAGQPSDGTSGLGGLSITDDGRYVSFSSYAPNLVANDTNEFVDLFVFDRTTQAMTRASVSSTGTQADSDSTEGGNGADLAVAPNGHVVVGFTSRATNLVAGDPGPGVFLHDLTTGQTERLLYSPEYTALSDLSPDGNLVVFFRVVGDTTTQVYLLDRTTDEIELISANSAGEPSASVGEGGQGSYLGNISDDGRYVAFGSDANNLVGGDTNAFCEGYDPVTEQDVPTSCYEAFVRDRVAGTTTRVSIADDGEQGDFRSYTPRISRDGSTVAFVSYASNLIPGDTNGMGDAFVRPRGMQPVETTEVAPMGGTVSAGTSTDAAHPVAASVTSPQGGPISVATGDTTEAPPAGYSFFGQQVSITAPPATTSQPLTLTFTLDESLFPPGTDPVTAQVFRSEGPIGPDLVADCTSTSPAIAPDPCVSQRTASGGGVVITVLTSQASIWNFGLEEGGEQPPPPPRVLFTSTRDGNAEIYSMNEDGSDVVRLTTHPRIDAGAVWSPDRSRIAFTSTRHGNSEIYLMNADGSGVVRLTNSPNADLSPSWSPDGTKVAFSSERRGKFDIWSVKVDGTALTRLTNDPHDDLTPAWSRDGTRIAFATDRKGNDFEIYVMNANGTGLTALTNNKKADLGPSWSRDGSRIAFASDRNGNFEIYTMASNGTGVARLTNHAKPDVAPSWSADGARLYFSSTRPGNLEIYSMAADGTDVQRLTNNGAADTLPDG